MSMSKQSNINERFFLEFIIYLETNNIGISETARQNLSDMKNNLPLKPQEFIQQLKVKMTEEEKQRLNKMSDKQIEAHINQHIQKFRRWERQKKVGDVLNYAMQGAVGAGAGFVVAGVIIFLATVIALAVTVGIGLTNPWAIPAAIGVYALYSCLTGVGLIGLGGCFLWGSDKCKNSLDDKKNNIMKNARDVLFFPPDHGKGETNEAQVQEAQQAHQIDRAIVKRDVSYGASSL